MIFRTIIENLSFSQKIKLKDNLFFIGSCFSDNIGNKLSNFGLNCTINPYGATYNPISVCKVLENIYKNSNISSKEIIEKNGIFNSLLHHSFVYGNSEKELKEKINSNNYNHKKNLDESNFIFITLGTSWVYEYLETEEIVNNCHKLPSSSFKRYNLTIEEIIEAFDNLFNKCKNLKNKKIIFTTVFKIIIKILRFLKIYWFFSNF